MLLTITLNRSPATDLGYLLHKHPAKLQEVAVRSVFGILALESEPVDPRL